MLAAVKNRHPTKKSRMKLYGYDAWPIRDKALQPKPRLQLLPTNRLLPYLTNMVVPLATVFVAKLHPSLVLYFLLVLGFSDTPRPPPPAPKSQGVGYLVY